MKKRKFKSVFALPLSIAVALAVTGCKDKETGNNQEEPSQTVEYTVEFVTNGGSAINSKVVSSGSKVSKPTDPTKEGFEFKGWYTDEACTKTFSFDSAITANVKVYAKWEAKTPTNTNEDYIQYVDVIDLGKPARKTEEDIKVKGFTIEAGVEFRGGPAKNWTKTTYEDTELANCDKYTSTSGESTLAFKDSFKITNTAGISFKANGTGYVSVYAHNGSGSAPKYVEITVKNLTDETETIYKIPGKEEYNSPVAQLSFDVEDGKEYQILRTANSGTVDVYAFEIKTTVEYSEVVGCEIDMKGTEEFFEGQVFNTEGLSVVSKKESGATTPLESNEFTVTVLNSQNQTIDTTKGFTAPGTYTVSVKYQEFEAKTYSITVYAFDSVELGHNVTIQGKSDGFNGTYINHAVQQVYKVGDTLDKDGLSIHLVAPENAFDYMLALNDSAITFSDVDMTTAGEKEVTVTVTLNGISKSDTYKIYVVDTTACKDTEGNLNVTVNPTFDGVVGAKSTVNGVECNTFKTIQQALDFIGFQDDIDGVFKNIYVQEGTYKEKLEITIPGTRLIGAGKDKTIIEWDSVYGIADEGGFAQVTDSTQTVAVRRSATNVTIKGITISNYYNHIDKYENVYKDNGERGLALLVQADMFIMEDGELLGWQDTLETFTGRQLFKNVHITGCVDFIFGTNSTTLFDNCEIEALLTKKSNQADNKIGAYVTAYKGDNGKGETITYGAIFNECNFTTSDDFIGGVAIARPWAANSNVTIINSTFGDKYVVEESKAISNGLLKDVNVDTLKIKLAGNKFASSGEDFVLTDDLANLNTVLEADKVQDYTDYTKIFAKTNGNVTFDADWDPNSSKVVVDEKIYYNFDGVDNATGTNYKAETGELNGTTGTVGDLAIDATNGKFSPRAGDVQFNKGTKITFNVKAGSSVYVKSYYGYVILNGIGLGNKEQTLYFAVDTEVVLETSQNEYLYKLVIDPKAEASELVLDDIALEGTPTEEFAVNTELDLSKLKVKAVYTNGAYEYLSEDKITLDTSAVDKTTAGTYKVVVSALDKTKEFNVKYVGEVSPVVSTTTTWSFKDDTSNAGDGYYVYDDSAINPTLEFNKLTLIDNGQGVISNNNDWLKFNAGAKAQFEVSGPCTVSVSTYNNENKIKVLLDDTEITATAGTYVITGAGIVTIESTAAGYIGKITAEFAVESNPSTSTGGTLDLTKITVAKDKEALNAESIGEENSFLQIKENSKNVTARTDKNTGEVFCIEIKGDDLSVNFSAPGTITIKFASTGSAGTNKLGADYVGNVSAVGLKNAEGNYIAATTVGTGATLIVADADFQDCGTDDTTDKNKITVDKTWDAESAGAYYMSGTTYIELTFTITEAGTYTISSPSSATGRGCRIESIVMTVNQE